ncbi:CG13114 [Drosophila busckii]|uniref:CG13114 n=2 Tax=Drosophila busckii TaxID=30019 RepID=A0A0M5J182_DROBS|nr:CG13114 [Drosophila busckii]
MIVRNSLLCALLALTLTATSTLAHFPQYCAECEQEIWEQVPCSEISSTTLRPPIPTTASPGPGTDSTTPSSTPLITSTSTSTAAPPTTYVPTTRPYPIYHPTYPSTTPSSYQKCYCECKSGCKDFCRKVSVAHPKQQLTQITSTGEYAPGGQLEYTHTHQRKYYPKYAPAKAYKPYPLAYSESAAAASSPAANNINAPNYTLEELAHLLSSA